MKRLAHSIRFSRSIVGRSIDAVKARGEKRRHEKTKTHGRSRSERIRERVRERIDDDFPPPILYCALRVVEVGDLGGFGFGFWVLEFLKEDGPQRPDQVHFLQPLACATKHGESPQNRSKSIN